MGCPDLCVSPGCLENLLSPGLLIGVGWGGTRESAFLLGSGDARLPAGAALGTTAAALRDVDWWRSGAPAGCSSLLSCQHGALGCLRGKKELMTQLRSACLTWFWISLLRTGWEALGHNFMFPVWGIPERWLWDRPDSSNGFYSISQSCACLFWTQRFKFI